MIIVVIYIISAFLTYIFAYKLIRRIDKKEREKLNNWEYTTLGEVKALLSDIYAELPDNLTLGAIQSYVEEKKAELKK